MSSDDSKPRCFIAMPISVHEDEKVLYRDADHWLHVMEHLFVPSLKKAGYEPVRPSAEGTSMIHGRIVKELTSAELVLCDLSQHNPNVMFELGVRTSLNLPVVLVKDEHLKLPFDISGLNTFHYDSWMTPWKLERQIESLANHVRQTANESRGKNPLWHHFGVSITAGAPSVDGSVEDARLELIASRLESLEYSVHAREHALKRSDRLGWGRQDETTQLILQTEGVVGLGSTYSGDSYSSIEVSTEVTRMFEQEVRAEKLVILLKANGILVEVQEITKNSIVLVNAEVHRPLF